jgi:hypothetical protein
MLKTGRLSVGSIEVQTPCRSLERKIKTAVTDSGSEIRCDAAKPGISDRTTLTAAVSGEEEGSTGGK